MKRTVILFIVFLQCMIFSHKLAAAEYQMIAMTPKDQPLSINSITFIPEAILKQDRKNPKLFFVRSRPPFKLFSLEISPAMRLLLKPNMLLYAKNDQKQWIEISPSKICGI